MFAPTVGEGSAANVCAAAVFTIASMVAAISTLGACEVVVGEIGRQAHVMAIVREMIANFFT